MHIKIFSVFLLCSLLFACEEAPKMSSESKAPEVGIMEITPVQKNLSARYQGRVKAIARVNIIPELSGRVIGNHVREGKHVKRGDLLFEIDPAPYAAVVEQMISTVEQARSSLNLVNVKFKMSESLSRKGALSQLDREQIKVEKELASAELVKSEANLSEAKIKLKKTKIYSPIDGTAGVFLGDVGDFVSPAKGTVLTVIADQVVQVYAQIGEKQHSLLSLLMKSENYTPDILQLELADGSIYPYEGKLDYIGTHISETTGTITYRLMFSNPEGALLDGQMVTIIATDIKPTRIILIPQKAVQEDQQGRFVYVFDDNNIVSKKYVTLTDRFKELWTVSKGLVQGERIIVSGILRAKPGSPVKPIVE